MHLTGGTQSHGRALASQEAGKIIGSLPWLALGARKNDKRPRHPSLAFPTAVAKPESQRAFHCTEPLIYVCVEGISDGQGLISRI